MKGEEIEVGMGVVYQPYGGRAEDGVVTEIKPSGMVMVRYSGDQHAKATYPHDLRPGPGVVLP